NLLCVCSTSGKAARSRRLPCRVVCASSLPVKVFDGAVKDDTSTFDVSNSPCSCGSPLAVLLVSKRPVIVPPPTWPLSVQRLPVRCSFACTPCQRPCDTST